MNTMTDPLGVYRFTDVPNGTYRLVFTGTPLRPTATSNARVSEPFVVNDSEHVVDVSDFTLGPNRHVLMALVAGPEGSTPADVTLQWNQTNWTAGGTNLWQRIFDFRQTIIGTIRATAPGYYDIIVDVTAECYENNFALIPLNFQRRTPDTGAVRGEVRESVASARVAGAHVALINMENGSKVYTATDTEGAFRFDDVPNGTYRLVFTKEGHHARISGPIAVYNNERIVNQLNFTPTGALNRRERVLLVRLSGLPSQNPPGTNVTLTMGGSTLTLVQPGANATNHFWHFFGNEFLHHPNGGVGTLRVSTPGFEDILLDVTVDCYVNLVALITADFGTALIDASPAEPDFGSHPFGYEPQQEQLITVTNIGTIDVMLNPLPYVPDWTLTQDADWLTSFAPGQTRTFTIRPDNGLPVGTHNPAVTITGIYGVSATIRPAFEVVPAPMPTVSLSASRAADFPGSYVDIVVSIDANEGLTFLGLNMGFDANILEFAGHTIHDIMLLPPPYNFETNPFRMNFELLDPYGITTETGNLAAIRFRILDDAAYGSTQVTLEAVSAGVADGFTFVPVSATAVNGYVTVEPGQNNGVIPGDANGDGRVTSADGTRLARYLAGHNVRIDKRGMDLNLDGYVDGEDLILLAGWLMGQGAPPAVQ